MRTTAAVLLITALAVSTAACTTASEPEIAAPSTTIGTAASTPQVSPTGPASTTSVAEAGRLWRTVLANVRQTPAIRTTTQAISADGDEVTTLDTTGVWVSRADTWQTTTDVDAPPASWDIPDKYVDRTERLRFVDSRFYVGFARERNRTFQWIDLTNATGYSGFGWAVRPTSPAVHLLFRIEPISWQPAEASAVVTGTLPNRLAIEALGLTDQVQEFGLADASADGRTTVRLHVSRGLPTRLEFLGADMDLTSPEIPSYRRSVIAASSYRTDYTTTADEPHISPPLDPLIGSINAPKGDT